MRANLAIIAVALFGAAAFAQQSGAPADGSYKIRFGGCDGKIPNCFSIVAGWNYSARLYRPRPEILNGSWKVPKAQPVT